MLGTGNGKLEIPLETSPNGRNNNKNYNDNYSEAEIIQKATKAWFFGKKQTGIELLLGRLCKNGTREISSQDYQDLLLLISSMLHSHSLTLEDLDRLWELASSGIISVGWQNEMHMRAITYFMLEFTRNGQLIQSKDIFEYWLSAVSDQRLQQVLSGDEKTWLDEATRHYLVDILADGLQDLKSASDFLFFNVYLSDEVKRDILAQLEYKPFPPLPQQQDDNNNDYLQHNQVINDNENRRENHRLELLERLKQFISQHKAQFLLAVYLLLSLGVGGGLIRFTLSNRRRREGTLSILKRKILEFLLIRPR